MKRAISNADFRRRTVIRGRRAPARRGAIALEELLTLAIMLPLAFAIFFFTWSMSSMVYHVIRTLVLTPIL